MPHVDICDAERLCTDAALVLDASTRVASAAGSGVLRVTLPHTVGLDADRTIPNVVETLVYCGLDDGVRDITPSHVFHRDHDGDLTEILACNRDS